MNEIEELMRKIEEIAEKEEIVFFSAFLYPEGDELEEKHYHNTGNASNTARYLNTITSIYIEALDSPTWKV